MPAPPPSRSAPGPPKRTSSPCVPTEQVVVGAGVELVVARVAEQDVPAEPGGGAVVSASSLEAVAEAASGHVIVTRAAQHQVEGGLAADVAVVARPEVARGTGAVSKTTWDVALAEAVVGADGREPDPVVAAAGDGVDLGDLRAGDAASARILSVHLDQPAAADDEDVVGPLAARDPEQPPAERGAHLGLGSAGAHKQGSRHSGEQGEAHWWAMGERHRGNRRNTRWIGK